MNKDEILKLAKELHLEAFNANSYYSIIEQYKKYHREYNSEMNISPTFHHLVYDALQKACFMEIAKLYDKAKGTVSIGTLLKECQDNISVFPEYRDKVSIRDDGNEYIFPVPYQHTLRPAEERFFIDEVTTQRKIYKIFDVSSENKPVQIDLTFPDFLELYQKRFCSLRKKQENIRIQRNKIYAHNDGQSMMDYEAIYQSNPVLYQDIKELIEFALDCTGLILGSLTGTAYATTYSNIDDLEGTLMYTKLGLKYQDYDLELKEKAFAEDLKHKLRGENND